MKGEKIKININQGKEEVVRPLDQSLTVLEGDAEDWMFEPVVGAFEYKYKDEDGNEKDYLNKDDYGNYAIVKVKLRPKSDAKFDDWIRKIKESSDKKAYLYLYVKVDADETVSYRSNTEDADKRRFCNRQGEWLEVNTCYCNRDITEGELEKIVTELRKREIYSKNVRQGRKNTDGNTDWYYIDPEDPDSTKLVQRTKNNKKVYYTADTHKLVTDVSPVILTENRYFSDLKFNLFKSKKSEKINSTVTFKSFAEELNKVFNTYEINTCIRKIHFLAQCYHETNRFVDTYEGKNAITHPRGGRHYLARGIMHMTHIEIYRNFYIHLNGRKPTDKELKEFVPTIAKRLELACVSAGFYWKYSGIYKEDKKGEPLIGDLSPIADTDDVIEVSRGINGYVSEKNINGLKKRKKYTKDLKAIMDYANCISK